MIGPIYATLSSLLNYTSKEKYWEKLEIKKNKYKMLNELNSSKPVNRIKLEIS